MGLLLLLLGLAVALSLLSYSPADPSWDTATGVSRTRNLLGLFGAKWADLLLQIFGVAVFLLPVHLFALGWKWVRSSPIESPWFRVAGAFALWFCISAGCGLLPHSVLIAGAVRPSGLAGMVIADGLRNRFNLTGAALITAAACVIAIYFATAFEVSTLMRWLSRPLAKWNALRARWHTFREASRQRAVARAKERAAERAARRKTLNADADSARPRRGRQSMQPAQTASDEPPFDLAPETAPAPQSAEQSEKDIPIRALAYNQPVIRKEPEPEPDPGPQFAEPAPASSVAPKRRKQYSLPPTELLNEVPAGSGYDGLELKEIASRIKSKLEEFNVRGSVVQINPGPVVTTFEYKPEAGVKYSRITTLTEDLCLGLQAESILIERLPGKPTVGIEVPNTRREVISLREILESGEFHDSPSRLTITLGKDINGRIKV
ncbi:MAG: DNA translocase FtsK 4TM domain-containing protein, partial [Bryobacteraceae bacterium]